MKQFLVSLFLLCIFTGQSYAAVLVQSPNGDYTTKTTLAAAAASLDAVGKTIVVTSAITINDVTIPSTVAFRTEKGAIITVNSGKTLTINGSFESGQYQVFAGSGTVSGLKYVNAAWFADTQAGTQQALNAVAATGVFEINTVRTVTAVTSPVGMTIRGSGGFTQLIADVGNHVLTVGADNTTIDGITITGPVTTGNTNFANKAGINIQSRSNILIKNCTITGKQNGIQNIESDTAVTSIKIDNCTIRHTGYGIVIWPAKNGGASVTTDYGNHITVTNNDVRLQAGYMPNNNIPGDLSDENIRGIRISHCDNVYVRNNTVYGQQLTIESWQQAGNKVATNVNFINNNVDHWMSFDGVIDGSIRGNSVNYYNRPSIKMDSPLYGTVCGIELIRSNNISIDSNVISHQPGNGIYTGYAGNGPGSATTSFDLAITNNVIDDCALVINFSAGIQLGYVHDIKVANNTIRNCGGSSSGSFAIASGGKITVIGGTFFAPVYNIEFSNNIITNTISKAASTAAIYLYNIKNVMMTGNIVQNTVGDVANGISLGSGFTSNIKLTGNSIINNAGYGLFVTGTNLREVMVEENDFSGNGSGATNTGTPGVFMALRYNKNLINEGNANTKNSFEIGDIYNISAAVNKWVRATVAGTFIVGAPIVLNSVTALATTTLVTPNIITVNSAAALALEPGQYIAIAGATTGLKVRYISPTFDSNGYTGATVTLSGNVTAAVTDAEISYVAGTMAQVL